MKRVALATMAVLLMAGFAGAATITDGDVTAEIADSWGDMDVLSYDAGTTDHVFEVIGYIGNSTAVPRVISAYFDETTALSASGDTATSSVSLSENGANLMGLAAGDINVDFAFRVTSPDTFSWQATITNNTESTQNWTFYQYADLDIDGDYQNDSAGGGLSGITVSESTELLWAPSTAADGYEVAVQPAVRNKLDQMLNNGVSNLANGTLPFGPEDFSGAYQWDLTLAAGGSATVGSTITLVPEPGTVILVTLLGMVGIRLRRRRHADAA